MPLQRIANTDISLTGSFSFPVISGNTVIQATDNTNAALRITQLGTGNALVVEDSANPDSTPFVVDASGNVGIGTTTPANPLHVNGTSAGLIRSQVFNAGNLIDYYTAEGSSSSPTALLSDRQIAGLRSYGYNGTSYLLGGSIDFQAESAWSGSASPSYFRIRTMTGAGVLSERMRVSSNGRVGIATTNPQTTLDVFGTIQANSVTVTANTVVPDLKAFQVTSPDRHTIRPSLLLDFANAKVLDPRITFTRASTGTYYDGKTVAKAEENLIYPSEDFTSARWGKNNLTITANTAVAPDGTTTADTFDEGTATGLHRIYNSSIFAVGTVVTFSVYLKYVDRQYVQVKINSSNEAGVVVDMTTGTIVSNFTTTGWTLNSYSSTSVGNGWYRVVVTGSKTSGTEIYGVVALSDSSTAGNDYSYTGTNKTVYVWGAQLEARSSVTAYTATTTAPITNYIPALQTAASGVARFEHNPVTGESLGLEVEEQRTNLALRSEEFDNAYWTKTAVTILANQNIAPDGTLTSDQITSDVTNSIHDLSRNGLSSSTSSTVSIYAKKGSARYLYLSLNHTGNSDYSSVVFDLETGTAGTVVNAGNYTGGQATITSVGNGWYRVSLSASHTTANDYVFIGISDSLNPSRAGRGRIVSTVTGSLFIWGAQLEAGVFPTSYIKTEGSTATRNADTVEITNLTSIIQAGQVDTTVYCEARKGTKDDGIIYGLVDSTGTFNQSLYSNPNFNAGSSNPSLLFNGVGQFSGAVSFTGNTIKTAFAFRNNDMQQAVNGTASATDTSGRIPQYTKLTIGQSPWGYDNHVNGYISKLAIYPKRLTTAELQGLTTI